MKDIGLQKDTIIAILLFTGVFVSAFYGLIYAIPVIFIIAYILIKNKIETFKLSLLDLGIGLLVFSEIITTFFSVNSFNSLGAVTRLFIISFVYLLYKLYARKKNYYLLFLMFFFVITTALLFYTIIDFREFSGKLLSHGFNDYNEFKNLYTPFNRLSNIWGAVLILIMPINLVLLMRLKSKEDRIYILLNLAMNIFCIIVSFSRGIYLSAIIFILFFSVVSIKFFKLKEYIIFLSVTILLFFGSAFIVKDSFLTTVKFNKTVSQQRSTHGRLTQWEHSLKQFKERPFFGFGQKNFVLSVENDPLVSEDVAFNGRANNTFIQLLVERGVFGFISYMLFILIVIKIIWHNLKSKTRSNKEKLQILIVLSGLIAFLIRELTFSTFFESSFVNLLAFHLIFLLIPYDIEMKQISISKKQRKYLKYFIYVSVLSILFLNIKSRVFHSINDKFLTSYDNGNIKTSLNYIDKTSWLSPNNITIKYQKVLAMSKNILRIKIASESENLLSFEEKKLDSIKLSQEYLEEILNEKPNDPEITHNLGWFLMAENKYEEAESQFKKSLQNNPYVIEYQCSLVLSRIMQSKYNEVITPLSKILQYSPDVLESPFFIEFEKKFDTIAIKSKSIAISNLKAKLKNEGKNPIYEARLARLLLNSNKEEALVYLNSVIHSLPNLNRPWLYKAYLKSQENDTIAANEFFAKAKYLNGRDYLNYLYEGNYHRRLKNDSIAVVNFERMYMLSDSFEAVSTNKAWNKMSTIKNSVLPIDLLYYLKPNLNPNNTLGYLENYYEKVNDTIKTKQFKKLSAEYQHKVFMGKID